MLHRVELVFTVSLHNMNSMKRCMAQNYVSSTTAHNKLTRASTDISARASTVTM